jgi:hypothetical protein
MHNASLVKRHTIPMCHYDPLLGIFSNMVPSLSVNPTDLRCLLPSGNHLTLPIRDSGKRELPSSRSPLCCRCYRATTRGADSTSLQSASSTIS